MNTHKVLRAINGRPEQRGDLVDASAWRNRDWLERNRYIEPCLVVVDAGKPTTLTDIQTGQNQRRNQPGGNR